MAHSSLLLDSWYGKRAPWLPVLLRPLACLFSAIVNVRRRYLQTRAREHKLPLPVIIVGNINLGGSGKTPLLIALCGRLRQAGLRPGIVSRGYGNRAPHYPFVITPDANASEAGDEPLMIARACACPVVIDSDRLAAARALVALGQCDVILSDDGLQHYRLPRDLEIVVVDGQRLLGNEQLLPAGPLREGMQRLAEVDWVFINGGQATEPRRAAFAAKLEHLGQSAQEMHLQLCGWHSLRAIENAEHPASSRPWAGESKQVHAVAGIGNPPRFFAELQGLGLEVIAHPFPDHHHFSAADLNFGDHLPVVMTEKDAVKCQHLLDALPATGEFWFLRVEAQLPEAFFAKLLQSLQGQGSVAEAQQSSARAMK